MTEQQSASGWSGFGRRRQRLSDAETERRMLETAAAEVARLGLTVSLEHIRLEDVIREAGVSRSTVYRRWPQKEMFLGDLLLELARASAPLSSLGGGEAAEIVRSTVVAHRDWLTSIDGRQRLLAELVRKLVDQEFRRILASNEWRTYYALTVTFISLPEGELRQEVQQALASSERTFIAGIVQSMLLVADMLGLRLRSGIDLSYEDVAHVTNALGRGLFIKALVSPELATHTVKGELFGVKAEWSLSALGLFSVVSTWFEPDPDIVWDDARIEPLLQRLESLDDLVEGTPR